MTDPLRGVGSRVTPQSEPVPGKAGMVENSAGGFTFEVDDWTRLLRFLILGSEGGTYYVSERKLTLDNAGVVTKLAATDGVRLVDTLVEVSVNARAPKVNPTLFALAVACAAPDQETRRAAYAAIPKICRTGTHLFLFAGYVEAQRGWGRGLRRAVSDWYTGKEVASVAYQAVKYRQREGWTHRDLLRLAHPKAVEADRKALFDFICNRPADLTSDSLRIVEGYQRAQEVTNPTEAAKLVSEYGLPWEALPDTMLSAPVVWEAILDAGMGVTALIRNLARLTRLGVITPMGTRTTHIAEKVSDLNTLRAAKVHPIQLLDALLTYGQGHGARGQDTWTPVAQIVDALDRGFYAAFGAIEPAGKRTMLAIDVSGSMGWQPVAGSAVLTPATAAGAMALVTAATEPEHVISVFADQLKAVAISPRQRLDDVMKVLFNNTFGRTDCAAPMLAAKANNIEVDTFVVYTDNETWAGNIHPFQALQQYRQATGINARLVVCGMTATEFTIADPTDPGMLDVAGFDTATPNIIAGFSRGDF